MLSEWGVALRGLSGMWFLANQERPWARGIHPRPTGSVAGWRRDPAGIQSGVTLDWRGGSRVHPAGGGRGGGGIRLGANQEPPWAELRSGREPIGRDCGVFGDPEGSQSCVQWDRMGANQELS